MNFDESKVPSYELPSPWVTVAGERVKSREDWWAVRRPELLRLFEDKVYGRMYPRVEVLGRVIERSKGACHGMGERLQVEIVFPDYPQAPILHLVIYLPIGTRRPVPCFLGLSFNGLAASFDDPALPLSSAWFPDEDPGIIKNRATDACRGTGTGRWPLEMILRRGYGLATLYYGDLEADHAAGFPDSLRALFQKEEREAGALNGWAWGLSRVLDVLEQIPEIDASRVALTGHSRLGKTALWAAACDSRFALVISNQSGCGGASLSKRNFGETLFVLSHVQTHWFNESCQRHSGDPAFPIDQHLLLSLIAPRPLFISSAEDDDGADPQGEFLSAFKASEVYQFLGVEGLTTSVRPPVGCPVFSRLGYGIRSGQHGITPTDWAMHLDFADRHLHPPVVCTGESGL